MCCCQMSVVIRQVSVVRRGQKYRFRFLRKTCAFFECANRGSRRNCGVWEMPVKTFIAVGQAGRAEPKIWLMVGERSAFFKHFQPQLFYIVFYKQRNQNHIKKYQNMWCKNTKLVIFTRGNIIAKFVWKIYDVNYSKFETNRSGNPKCVILNE